MCIRDRDKPEEILRSVVSIANHKLIEAASRDIKLEGMGTTLVAATVVGNTLYFANVGDSRLYLINDKIRQLSKDHSLVEEMVRLGGIKAEEARNHPDKNIITRAIGVKAVSYTHLPEKQELLQDRITQR